MDAKDRAAKLEKESPWRICWGCNDYHVTIIEHDEGEPLTCECKTCGRGWDLACPRCGWTVYGTEEKGTHRRALCLRCNKTQGEWNIKRRKRGQSIVWMAKERLDKVCAQCGCTVAEGEYEMDHKVALCRGGKDIVNNMQVLCIKCHDDKTFDDCGWRR